MNAWTGDTSTWSERIGQGLNAAHENYCKQGTLRGIPLLASEDPRYPEIRDAFFAVLIDPFFTLDDRVLLTLFQQSVELADGEIVGDTTELLYEMCGDFFLTQELRLGRDAVTGLGIDHRVAGHLTSVTSRIQFCLRQHPSLKRRLINLARRLDSIGKRRIPLLFLFSCFPEDTFDDRTRTDLAALIRRMITTFEKKLRVQGVSQESAALSDELRYVLWELGPRLADRVATDLYSLLLVLDLALQKFLASNEWRSIINGPFDATLDLIRRTAIAGAEEELFRVLRKFTNDYLKTELLKALGEFSDSAAVSDYLAQYLKIPYEKRARWKDQVDVTDHHDFIVLSSALAGKLRLKPEIYDYDEPEDRCYVARDHRTEAIWSLVKRNDSRAIRHVVTGLRSNNEDWRDHCLDRIQEDGIAHRRFDHELLHIINRSPHYRLVEQSLRILVNSRPAKALTSLRRFFREVDNGRRFREHAALERGQLQYLAGCALLAVGDPSILPKLHRLYLQTGELDAITTDLIRRSECYAQGMFRSLVPHLGSREGPLASLSADLILNTLISVSRSNAKSFIFDSAVKLSNVNIKFQFEKIIAQTPMNPEYLDWVAKGRMIVEPIFKTRGIAEKSRTCFVVMPFRKRWSKRVWSIVRTTLETSKFTCWRADELTDQNVLEDIWRGLNEASVILVDLSGRNPNVFYEFGIAHTLGKQVIVLTQTKNVPFDVNLYRWIHYKPTRSGLARLRRDLEKRISSLSVSPAQNRIEFEK